MRPKTTALQRFPSSRNKAEPNGFIGFDPEKDNPLQVLYPHEAVTAELFVLAQREPRTAATMPPNPGKWGTLRSGVFTQRFREMFGFDLTPSDRKGLESNLAWRAYVTKLQAQTREAVMEKMRQDALAAYQDYTWSRTAAREAGDYKETRIAAGDHLDRIGATEKPTEGGQSVLVVLRGRNFDEHSLDKQLPETTSEIVVPASDVEVLP